MELIHQLEEPLKRLRLSGMFQSLAARNQQAIEGHWSYIEFLARLLEDEVGQREQKQLALRVRRAGLNTAKTLEAFDFSFNTTIDRQRVLDLATGQYIREHGNAVLCGPTGVGKSHLATALAAEACIVGFKVLFVHTHKMLQDLFGGRADDSREQRLQTYLRPDLLVLDDFGLRPLQNPQGEDLYDVIDGRYEQGSLLVTSNRAPSEWPELFGDPLLASAGLDRLLHHAKIVIMTGPSYRAQSRSEKTT